MFSIHINIIDQSGIQQALDFDYRSYIQPTLYADIRKEIKGIFSSKIELIKELFPQGDLVFNVNLEQEKGDSLGTTLASFDPERSRSGNYVFHIYYDSITQVADSLISDNGKKRFYANTVLHELIHAVDLMSLKEMNLLNEKSYRLYGISGSQALRDISASNYEWNVQYTMLRYFQNFRNEGLAMLGQHLLDDSDGLKTERPINMVLDKFKNNLNRALGYCSGLKFYNIMETTRAHELLRELSLEAYVYGDLLLLEALKTAYPSEIDTCDEYISCLTSPNLGIANKDKAIGLLKLAMEMDLSEYLHAVFNNEILNRDEPLSKAQLFECCAIIQNDTQGDLISHFSKKIGYCGYNKDRNGFIDLLYSILGSKMNISEINDLYTEFINKEYPEDIIIGIQKMAAQMLPLAVTEADEVAIWALTYLLDNEELIFDDLPILGWQDDWMVLHSACRILGS